MGSRFDATYLSASPCYPNAIAWSEENLLAVGSGHVVTVLNPSSLSGPRGWITLRSRPPVQIGVVKRQDLLAPCLLPTCLTRDTRPCVRSMSWSHQGLAPNSGCLLAVCTIDGNVKLYRAPFCDFRAEWVDVLDISDKLYGYYLSVNFEEILNGSTGHFHKIGGQYQTILSTSAVQDRGFSLQATKKACVKEDLRRVSRDSKNRMDENHDDNSDEDDDDDDSDDDDDDGDANNAENCVQPSENSTTISTELALIPCMFSEGTSVEVLKHESSQRFWINGKIVRISEGKAFVHFAEAIEEQHDGWFSLKFGPDKGKEAASSFNMRPTLDLGRLPNEIYLVEHSKEVMEVLVKGQLVEAWVDNRWIEGAFLGTSDAQLLIDLHGDYGRFILSPENVRLMPIWIPDENSWQITVVKLRKMTTSLHDVPDVKCATGTGRNINQDKRKESSRKRHEENAFPTSLSAEEYVFRSNLLSSLVVSWSPMLHLSTNLGAVAISGFSKTCALLAVGGKCGKISFWRFNEPNSYTVDQCPVSVDATLVGILQAHTSWVTAISWVVLESAPKFLLATGSCDGCVKLWLGDIEGMVTPKEVNDDCVCLLREVIVAAGPVSVLSCVAPSKSPNEILLAVGKGSGLLEVLSCDISSGEIKFNRQFNAHDQVVTGVAWAFDGHCLYSCSQDNSVHCWILQADTLCLVHFPLNSPSLAYDSKRTSSEIPRHIFDSCYGLALSPGNLVLGVVHSVDTALVDPMYESRAQRAAVELIWTGGMISVSLDNLPDEYVDAVPGFSDKDLVCWQSSILWTLEQYACPAKPLILWDIMEALLAFNQVSPNYVETILYNWFLSWWPDPDSLVSLESMLSSAPNLLHIIDSRHMHMINIVCRRLVLPEMKSVAYSSKHELQSVDVEAVKLWSNLLLHSEAELQRRLVGLTFSAVLYLASGTASALPLDRPCWFPTGVAQMQQWVVMNNNLIPDDLKLLKLEVDKIQKRRMV
ncbi:uncharacterized protein LOC116260564 isoform X3 [Nymphaea colorata]|uniref:uncharacterized protein LOC116260564 isoform X3 n=1 Tax=Nymphaea colorata TaxID=210225 RepID=UPI00129E4F44|nr:uncharacterized protein LOC116260564 isoform X3 [Nymphaea colorata]